MGIHINHIDPLYDQGMSWIRAEVDFRCYPSPQHPENPVGVIQTRMLVTGDPHETFAALQTRALQAAYALRERMLVGRRDGVHQQQPSQQERGTF